MLELSHMYIVGLGNPGAEYTESRHNVGRAILEKFRKKNNFSDWQDSKKMNGLISEGKIGKNHVTLMLPELYMNKSGSSVKKLVTNKKKAQSLIVVYDEIDMGLGTMKIVFNRGSGGHKGIESVVKSIGTPEFARLRVGISPRTLSGKIKKPKGDKKIIDFVLGKFTKKELEILKKIEKKAIEALETFIEEGRMVTMNRFN